MTLLAELDTRRFAANFEPIGNLLKHQARIELTFWGSRLIVITEVKEESDKKVVFPELAYDLNKIAKKVDRAAIEESKLTRAQCLAGQEIVKKLRSFYKLSDELVQNANFFTRLIVWIRESVMDYTRYREHIESKEGTEWWFKHGLRMAEHNLRMANWRRQLAEREGDLDLEWARVENRLLDADLERMIGEGGLIEWEPIDQQEQHHRVQASNVIPVADPPGNNCPVCLEPLNDGNPVVAHEQRDGGLHPIHRECMRRSLETTGGRCPFCRTPVNPIPDNRSFRERITSVFGTFAQNALAGIVVAINPIPDNRRLRERITSIAGTFAKNALAGIVVAIGLWIHSDAYQRRAN